MVVANVMLLVKKGSSQHARSLVNRKGREHIATQIDGSDGFTHPCYGW